MEKLIKSFIISFGCNNRSLGKDFSKRPEFRLTADFNNFIAGIQHVLYDYPKLIFYLSLHSDVLDVIIKPNSSDECLDPQDVFKLSARFVKLAERNNFDRLHDYQINQNLPF